MTTIKLYTINCDQNLNGGDHADGCPWWIGNERSAAEVNKVARDAGWKSERLGGYRYDYSPQCWANYHMMGARST